jgi:N-acetyl-alpha-D-glucosaminyl L-malate synthase BshA
MAKKILLSEGRYVPVITTLHGTDITLVGNNSAFKPVIEFSINKSDGVTAVSENLKQQTHAYFNIKKNIEVIPNFIDFERFKRSNKEHFRKSIAMDNERILIHVSNFRKVKRVEDVITVFSKVKEKIASKLLLIGDGPERWNAESYSRSLGLGEHIRFLGKQDAVEELMAVADLFLLTSEKEAFGLAALEAMACEVPVISTNAGGIPEVNINGVTGYVSEIGDVEDMAKNAISILSNEDTLAEFRSNALAQAKRFDINNVLPIYEAYYEEIIHSSVL